MTIQFLCMDTQKSNVYSTSSMHLKYVHFSSSLLSIYSKPTNVDCLNSFLTGPATFLFASSPILSLQWNQSFVKYLLNKVNFTLKPLLLFHSAGGQKLVFYRLNTTCRFVLQGQHNSFSFLRFVFFFLGGNGAWGQILSLNVFISFHFQLSS